MIIKALHHADRVMPSKKEIKERYADQGKFLAISPAIFGGWHVWFLAKKKLVLTPPPTVSQDALVREYIVKNKKYKVCKC